jgi:hypothetical protein
MRDGEGAVIHNPQKVAEVFIRSHSLANAVFEPLGAFEWVALSYLGFSGALMVIFHKNLERPAFHIAEHIGVAVAILVITSVAYRTSRGESSRPRIARSLSWVRDWYPQAVFLFCFEELRILVLLIEPAWQDSVLIAFDHWLTGVYPAVWLAQFTSVWLNEAMQVAYMSYYLFLTILGASLYRRRRDRSDDSPARNPSGVMAMRAFWR